MKNKQSDYSELILGLDVGSTTVKAVVMNPETDEVLWRAYRRHETRQPETLLAFLREIEDRFDLTPNKTKAFITGSGGGILAPLIGARFVQEVNAIALAVERFYPETGSIIEIGGQDSKIIFWIYNEKSGKKIKLPTMNDKCAGGTGAVIDKIGAKLGMTSEEIGKLTSDGKRLHPVAARCGVFAETDINSLQKQGVPAGELMNSLFEAIVQQNLSVLVRGNVLLPNVLLLGGPHTFIPALAAAWRRNIPKLWKEREFDFGEDDPEELIRIPADAEFFAAIGSVIFGEATEEEGRYEGSGKLKHFVEEGSRLKHSGSEGFFQNKEEEAAFTARYQLPDFDRKKAPKGSKGRLRGYIGIDGGSTSTKGVVLDDKGEVIARAYRLSAGNPIEDTKQVMQMLRDDLRASNIDLEVGGVGTTGYAKDMLKEALQADVAIVETVAHTKSALRYFDDIDVICDVGGQDIKVILLNHGRVTDFRLNTQCSAGNGYFLQSTARQFGYDVEDYAKIAFQAGRLPEFNFGCAVFLESDIVNFQQLGWRREEILAGLANVLPRNIWLYVVQEPNLKKLGRRFVLQGGTQKNLAAVKAQHDFIRERVPDAEIFIHPHTGESGAIGAALEARGATSSFIGFDALHSLSFSTLRDETTRCYFCKNKCLRTFVDLSLGTETEPDRRYIIAPCEKGNAVEKSEMLVLKRELDEVKKANPNLSLHATEEVFKTGRALPEEKRFLPSLFKREKRTLKIGIPRVLNLFSVAPFFIGYLESLGIDSKDILFSDLTEEEMFKEGSRRGAIDQCFPSKAAMAHIHNLLYEKEVDIIFFPILISLPSPLEGTLDSLACPTVQATPEVCRAAFTKDEDLFLKEGVRYLAPVLNMAEPDIFEHQLINAFGPILKIGRKDNRRAILAGWNALESYEGSLNAKGRELLHTLEREGRTGVVLLGRPYHNDPGLNHGIVEEIQKKGYPVFTIDSLPRDEAILDRLFGEEMRAGLLSSPLSIGDVWLNAFSENSSRKLWAAKYVARHPNLAALDLSNFKCGHDAPIYSVMEKIIHASQTPYFTFHDIDENKPSGSIKIRVETIDYFLKQYEETLKDRDKPEERDPVICRTASPQPLEQGA